MACGWFWVSIPQTKWALQMVHAKRVRWLRTMIAQTGEHDGAFWPWHFPGIGLAVSKCRALRKNAKISMFIVDVFIRKAPLLTIVWCSIFFSARNASDPGLGDTFDILRTHLSCPHSQTPHRKTRHKDFTPSRLWPHVPLVTRKACHRKFKAQ